MTADVAEWAAVRIRAGRARGPLPGYGSTEWVTLGDRDPRKVASVVVAAECNRQDGLDLPARLRDEIETARAVVEQWEADEWFELAHGVRHRAHSPTADELEARRWGPGGRRNFAAPRPGDYLPARQRVELAVSR